MIQKKLDRVIYIKELLGYFAIIILGGIYIFFIWTDAKNQNIENALQNARSIEASLPKEELKALEQNPENLKNHSYQQLKNTLQQVIRVNEDARFAYLYIERNDKLYFIVDSEPETSSDYSPPGQEFSEAAPIDKQPLRDGKALMTKPLTDRWGTWVSAEVPIKDDKTGRVIAVLGIDYNASAWENRILFEVSESILMVFIILILVFVSRRSLRKNLILEKEISQREKAEKKLKENESTLSNLIANLPGMVYRCALDENYTMEFMSEACFRITGYQPEDYIENKTISFNNLIFPEYRLPIWEKWEKVINEKSFFEDEYPIRTASGETKWIWERGLCIFNENGKPKYLEGYIEDMTDKKKNESELIKAKEKAEESDRLKSAFLANISHEIRTPMNGILGFAELLKEPDLSSENQQEFIDIIEKSGQRMLNIINDLIDISKIEAGVTTVKISETNVNKILQELHLFFMPEANQKNIHIHYKCDLDDVQSIINTDSIKLNQILMNLIKNAVKFTEYGLITFGYELKETKIEFFVTDTGPGIPIDKINLIFERFRQVSTGLSKKHEGAGLGLAISKAYVELLGGSIRVVSEEGEGSTFIFELPYQ